MEVSMTAKPPVFVHAADLHIGSPLRNLGKGVSDQDRKSLVERVDKAFDNLISTTITIGAEFIVLAGDIYDGAEREAHAQIRFSLGLQRLVDAGVGVYIVHGNHDPLINSVVNVVSLPEQVVVFGTDQVNAVAHKMRDGRTVIVAGISYADVREERPLATMFRDLNPDGAAAVVGVLHTNLGGVSTAHGNYAPSSESDLTAAPVDYWALGHVHKRQIKSIGQNRYWAYPGNLQGRDAGEEGEKGALVVPILTHGVGEPEFIALDTIRFAQIDLDCSEEDNLTGIGRLVNDRVKALTCDLPLILRVTLRGRSRAYGPVRETAQLEKALQVICGDSLNGGYVEKVRFQLLPALDVESLRHADDLLGDLLRAVETLSASDFDAATAGLDPSVLTDGLIGDLRNSITADLLNEFTNNVNGAA